MTGAFFLPLKGAPVPAPSTIWKQRPVWPAKFDLYHLPYLHQAQTHGAMAQAMYPATPAKTIQSIMLPPFRSRLVLSALRACNALRYQQLFAPKKSAHEVPRLAAPYSRPLTLYGSGC